MQGSDRLRPRDVAFLQAESAAAPAHNATVEIFDVAGTGFDYDRFVELVRERITFVPRYRQRVLAVPGRLANPVWVDDAQFDLGYHLRRSALPRPGSAEQLRELVARIVSRPLDRNRPLWEIYYVEGLAQGRVALLYKTHQALVDGVDTVDLGQVLLDDDPDPRMLGPDAWHAASRPSPAGLLAAAIRDTLTDRHTVPAALATNADAVLRDVRRSLGRTRHVVNGLTGRRPVWDSPLGGELSEQRRVVGVDTRLEDYRTLRAAHGGTINDGVLATVTGGLRAWLMARGESMGGLRSIRALVPVSVIDDLLEPTSLGSQVAAHYVDLPVGEPSAVVRLHQVGYAFEKDKESGRSVSADRLAGLSGFAPTTFHAVGSRVAAAEQRRGFAISVTNVPGPQAPLYAAGARMVGSYPVHPLLPGQTLAIGVTSYDGTVSYGITADRDLVPDADLLGQCITEALDELLDTFGTRTRAPRGRGRRKPAPVTES